MSDIRAELGQVRNGDNQFVHLNLPEFSVFQDSRIHYTTWLMVGYAADDDGTRSLPGGVVFWESPDVWVVSSAGINQPIPGEANTVFARVTNLGLQDARGVVVRFWWANPALAITESTAHQINPTHLPAVTVPSQSSVVVQCPDPWVPVAENNGHECLLVEAYIPEFDGLTAPLDPVDDRHVGMKNEQLVLAAKGHDFRIPLQAFNITGFSQALTFEVRRLRVDSVPQLLAARADSLRHRLALSAAALPLAVRIQDGPGLIAGPSALFARRLLSATLQEISGTARDCFEPAQISHTAVFAAWELRNLEIIGQVPPDAQVGDTFILQVSQRVGRMVTGGYTIHLVVGER
jgi:hypothetical protein